MLVAMQKNRWLIRIYSGRRAGKLSVAIELHALFDQDLWGEFEPLSRSIRLSGSARQDWLDSRNLKRLVSSYVCWLLRFWRVQPRICQANDVYLSHSFYQPRWLLCKICVSSAHTIRWAFGCQVVNGIVLSYTFVGVCRNLHGAAALEIKLHCMTTLTGPCAWQQEPLTTHDYYRLWMWKLYYAGSEKHFKNIYTTLDTIYRYMLGDRMVSYWNLVMRYNTTYF
jgi:hypothetical protein